MARMALKTRSGNTAALAANLDSLRASLRGSVCLPGEPGYEEARTLWNAMIDRCPALAINEHAVSELGVGGELAPIGGRYRVRNHALNQSFRGLTNRSNLNTFGP